MAASIEIDHLLYAGPDLEALKSDVTRRSGIAAASGGRHPDWGTHNALIGLGTGTYLELISPEPGSSGPWASLFGRLDAPSLQAWCVRCGSADDVADRLERAGLDIKRVEGGRELPGGGRLTWELVFPRGHGFGGALPFFIDWRDSVHPSKSLTAAASLARLTVAHPDAAALERVLGEVGTPPQSLEVVEAGQISLTASFTSRGGEFVLEGVLDPAAHLGEV